MRSMTTPALNAAMHPDAAPLLILRLDLPGGTRWFANQDLLTPVTAEGRIADCSPLEAVFHALHGGGHAEARLTLRDEDRTLHALLESDEFAGCPATLYQHFDTLGESDMTPLLGGRIDTPPVWREADSTLTLEIRGLDAYFAHHIIGEHADRLSFPDVAQEDEGALLPLVYGRPQRVKAVLVRAGASTELALPLAETDMTLVVQDAARFPTSTLRLRIGQEVVEGSFNGNVFTLTQRGVGGVSGTFGERAGNPSIVHTDLESGHDHQYAGRLLQATLGGVTQTRLVCGSFGGRLHLHEPFLQGDAYIHPEEGTPFEFASLQTSHPAGESVTLDGDAWIYLLNDRPSCAVRQVEGWGRIETAQTISGTPVAGSRQGYTPIPSAAYHIDLHDTTTFPGRPHPVTTLRMTLPPRTWPGGVFLTNEIWITLEGVPESGDTPLENPVWILKDLLLHGTGLDPAQVDDASFTAAAAARASVRCAFALPRAMPAGQVLQELAFQARLALLWEEGVAKLRPLELACPTPVQTLDDTKIALASVELTGRHPRERLTDLLATYRRAGDATAVQIHDPHAHEGNGRIQRTVFFWAFQSRHEVFLAAHAWLARWRQEWKEITVRTFLPGLPLERLDGVKLVHPLLPGGEAVGEVRAVAHHPGSPREGTPDRIALTVRLPYAAGCATSCETSCEMTACESSSCELSCTAATETACLHACETLREPGGHRTGSGAWSGIRTSTTLCTTTCQVGCETAEEPGADCETQCVTGCESSCESMAYESGCASGCETICEVRTGDVEIKPVRLLTAPASAFGIATVVELCGGGEHGAPFPATDAFDLNRAAGDECAALRARSGGWVLVPGGRDAKFVKVLSGSGSSYSVQEQDAGGGTWGAPFPATGVGEE